MKKFIKLTESDLHRIIKSSVKAYLKENQQVIDDFSNTETDDIENLKAQFKKAEKEYSKTFDVYFNNYREFDDELEWLYNGNISRDPTKWKESDFHIEDYPDPSIYEDEELDILNNAPDTLETNPKDYYITLIKQYNELTKKINEQNKAMVEDFNENF